VRSAKREARSAKREARSAKQSFGETHALQPKSCWISNFNKIY